MNRFSAYVSVFLLFACYFTAFSAMMKPNPIISRGDGVTVAVSSGEKSGINDKKFGFYAEKRWKVTDDSWVALKVVPGDYTAVFFIWNCPDTSWSDKIAVPEGESCGSGIKVPVDYEIMTSANSTDGSDGEWTTAVTIEGNYVAARGHIVDFTGATWIKMHITKGTGNIDEIEVFDITKDRRDTWFFLGTNITSVMFKGKMASGYTQRDKYPPDSNFAAMINNRNPEYTPAVIRGGVFCEVTSGDVVRDLDKYLEMAGNVYFWAIELGTYDAWGGGNENAAQFKTNLKIIVDSCKAHGIQPIIARVIATNPQKLNPKWQVHKDFLDAVDKITEEENLIPGVDLYKYFTTTLGAMDLANDGILLNDYGDFEMQREWNLKMDTEVYKADPVSISIPRIKQSISAPIFNTVSSNGYLQVSSSQSGIISIFSINGKMIRSQYSTGAVSLFNINLPGMYLVTLKTVNGIQSSHVIHY